MTRRLFVRLASLCAAGLAAGFRPLRSEVVARVDDGEWHGIVKTWNREAGDVHLCVDGRQVDRIIGLEDAEAQAQWIIGAFKAESPAPPQGTLAFQYRRKPQGLSNLSLWDRPLAPRDLPTRVSGGEEGLQVFVGLGEAVGVITGGSAA